VPSRVKFVISVASHTVPVPVEEEPTVKVAPANIIPLGLVPVILILLPIVAVYPFKSKVPLIIDESVVSVVSKASSNFTVPPPLITILRGKTLPALVIFCVVLP